MIKVVALKNVTYNEPYFQGHFPGFAILPGVLLIEIMAQTASFSLYPYMLHASGGDIGHLARNFQCILVGVDSARFRRPVRPGRYFAHRNDRDQVPGKALGFSVRDHSGWTARGRSGYHGESDRQLGQPEGA